MILVFENDGSIFNFFFKFQKYIIKNIVWNVFHGFLPLQLEFSQISWFWEGPKMVHTVRNWVNAVRNGSVYVNQLIKGRNSIAFENKFVLFKDVNITVGITKR